MKFRFLLFFLFVATTPLLWGQEGNENVGKSRLDSLAIVLETAENDSVRAYASLDWCQEARRITDSPSAWVASVPAGYLSYLDASYAYFRERTDTSLLLRSLAHLATYHWQNPDSADNHYLRTFDFLHGNYGYEVRENFYNSDSSSEYTYWTIDNRLLVFEDSTKSLSFEDIRQPFFQNQFTGATRFRSGFQTSPQDRVFWVKFRAKSLRKRDDDYRFEIGYGAESWRYVDVYIQDSSKSFSFHKTGSYVPLEQKMVSSWRNHFDVYVPGEESRWIYLRLAEPAKILTPLNFRIAQVNQEQLVEDEFLSWHINGIFFGMVLIQAVFFMFLFATTRISYYFYYVLFLGGLTLLMMSTNYLAYFFPAKMEYMVIINTCFACMLAISLLYFAFHFLDVEVFKGPWKKILGLLAIGMVLVSMAFLYTIGSNVDYFMENRRTLDTQLYMKLGLALGLMGLGCMVYWGIAAHRMGHKTARYLFIGLLAMLFGVGSPMITQIFEMRFMSFETAIISIESSVMVLLAFFALALGQQRKQLEEEKRLALEEKLGLQEKINAASAKFVPFEFIKSLGKENILDVKLGDATEREVTVFFSDIRGYTSLVENMSPEENFRFINDFHRTVGPSISEHHGFVNQYLGDGIMAIFLESKDHALRAAIEIQQKLHNYVPLIQGQQAMGIRLGIGLHAGSLVMGIIGDEKRTDAASISDTVNTASSMEGLTKYYGAPILMSGEVKEDLKQVDAFSMRYLGKVQVKGKQNSVDVFECLNGRPPQELEIYLKTQGQFHEGVEAYLSRNFSLAQKAFEEVLQINQYDKAAGLFLHNSKEFHSKGVSEEWDGVVMMKDK